MTLLFQARSAHVGHAALEICARPRPDLAGAPEGAVSRAIPNGRIASARALCGSRGRRTTVAF
eukprot:7513645-Pyramimonas_sp.AAC.1